jgi:hypothetical protein
MAQYIYNGSGGAPIDLDTAKKWVANYRSTNPGQIEAHFFGAQIINQILSEHDCMGIRIYYGIDDAGAKQVLLVGVDSNGNNLLPTGSNNIIADFSWPCPPGCPDAATSL